MPFDISKRQQLSRPLVALISLIFIYASLTSAVHAQSQALPEIGDPSGSVLSPAEERRLGKAFMRSVRKSMKVIPDPLMTDYIQSLGNRLVQGSRDARGAFTFFLVDNPQINAFAGPAGHIGVYTGLINATQSESELASVLAHEIAHVTQNHLVRTFDAVSRMDLPTAALALAALVVGAAANNPEAGVFMATGVQAAQLQRQINFTRAHEEEADSQGIKILANADFDPSAMAVFFERMGKATRLYTSGKLPEFLSTHPITTNRIADAYGRAGDYPYRQRPDSLAYLLLKAKLKVREIDNPKEAVKYFASSLAERRYRNEEAQRYGYVLALMAANQLAAARVELDKLLHKRPTQLHYIITNAQLMAASKAPGKGIKVLRDGLLLYPGNYPLAIHLADALLDAGRAKEALDLLEDQYRGNPEDTNILARLARAAGATGDKSLGHQYLAEYHYHSGDAKAALQQLQIALKDRNMAYFRSAQIAARLKEIREEVAEAEKRQGR